MSGERIDPKRMENLLRQGDAWFGARVVHLRLERNWSQEELAARIGVSHSMVSRYEYGKSSPSISTLIRLREALETTLDYLLAGVLPSTDSSGPAR
jgi:transcriptional regulator with XRE-family HTH domain